MSDLASKCGFADSARAAAVFESVAPLVFDKLADVSQSTESGGELAAMRAALSWVERETPEVLFEPAGPRFANELAPLIFGAEMSSVVASIAEQENVAETVAAEFLETISAVTLAVTSGHPDTPRTVDESAATSPANVAAPAQPQDTAKASAPVGSAKTTATRRAGTTAPTASDDGKSKAGLLVGGVIALLALGAMGLLALGGGGDEVATDEPTETVAPGADPTATNSEASTSGTEPEPTATETNEDPPDSLAVTSTLVAFGVPMVDITGTSPDASGLLNFEFDTETGEVCYSVESTNIGGPYRTHIHVGTADERGGIVVDMGSLESGATGCVENLPVDTNAILENRTGHYAELHDVSEEWTIRGQLSEATTGTLVAFGVPMVDITGTSPDASGLLNFEFDTETGEVCYSVESTNIGGPYRTHIHVGTADERGGIVVDMGSLESGATGCVENLPVDTNAILENRTGHYAELHDVSEEWTIRGQLSEATTTSTGESSEVDSTGGGASILLEGGTIYLEGAVVDQAAADDIENSLSGIDSATPVVNNLTIASDAPVPSGRVVIADAIFFNTNESQVKEIDENTLSAIIELALSRSDWTLTVVGHTDSLGSDVDNLELSLRRATALRDLLAGQGVPDENLRIRGAGETAPIGDNATDAGRAQNRRIEFEFTPNS